MSDSLRPYALYSPWNSPGQNTGVLEWPGEIQISLLQGIFPIHGLNSGLPRCRQILYQLSHKGSPRILEWVACPFSSGSSQSRNRTGLSCIAGRFFTNRAIREVHYWRNCLFSIAYYCPVGYRLIDCRCVGLFLGFLFCFIYLYVCFYSNTIFFWLLYLCSIIWSQGA